MFWLIAFALIAVTLVPVLRSVLSTGDAQPSTADLDIQIYKDQLAEVKRDVERGVLSEADAKAAETEVSRRILAADKRTREAKTTAGSDGAASRILAFFLVVGITGSSFWLYHTLGSTGAEDQPLQARIEAAKIARANRPDQAAAEAAAPPVEVTADAEYIELVEKLRAVVAERPDDAKGLRLLANHEARLGNLVAAREAQQQVIVVMGKDAGSDDYTDLAEIMIVAAGGYVSPEAEDTLARALRLDSTSPRARYYSGLALAQNGRPDIAYRMWENLLAEGPEDAPWIPLIRSQITLVARAAGVAVPDQGLRGPTAEDVENAGDMSAEDRTEMIQGMVANLADRLATEGGPPVEWARLIRAYGVLGETAQASAIWTESQEVFKDSPEALALLREAAQAAEVAQ